MRKNLVMGLGGLAAIVADYVVVASIVGLLLLTRWIGVGWTLDVLTVLLISYGIVAWFYGKRFSAFLNRQDDMRSDSIAVRNPDRRASIKATTAVRSRGSGSR
ncbi:MAG: hypothetical protein WCA22_09595 [Candidatus Binatus sp.]